MPGFVVLVVSVDLLDVEKRQQVAVDVAQRQRLALGDAVAGRDRQRHGQRPERAIGQPHLADDALVVGLAQEALQRREAADGEQLEIAQTALVERQAGKVLGGRLHLGGSFVADDQIDERPAVRRVQASGARAISRRFAAGTGVVDVGGMAGLLSNSVKSDVATASGPSLWGQMIHSWGEDCSASWAIVVWSSTARSAARTLSQTDASTEAVGRLSPTRSRRVAIVGTVDGGQDLARARCSTPAAPGDSRRPRPRVLATSPAPFQLKQDLHQVSFGNPVLPRNLADVQRRRVGPLSRQGENRQTRIFGFRGDLHRLTRLIAVPIRRLA